MSKCFRILTAIALCLTVLSGCSSNRHLKDMLVVEGLGIDAENSKINVTAQTLNVGMSNSTETPEGNMTVNTDADGNTISSALENMSKSLSKRLFFGQNKIAVIGKELAQSNMKNYIDYFLRYDDMRADIAVCVSKTDAKEILESKEHNASVPSESILNLIKNNEEAAQSILVSANDMLNLYFDETSDVYLPALEIDDDNESVSAGSIALFCGEKLSHITTDDETKGFVILQNKADEVTLELSDGTLMETNVKLSNIKCRKNAAIKNSKITFCVTITADMILTQSENATQKKLDNDDYSRLTELSQNELERLCKAAFDACISSNSDCLRIGEYLAKDNEKEYEAKKSDWKKYFSSSKLEIDSKITIEKISDNSQLE